MKKLVILLLFFITGCGIGCIEGSKGVSGTSTAVEVKPVVEKVSDVLQPNWIDTGLTVSENQPPVKLTILGAVNMCPKDSMNPKNIIVPAVTCAHGTYDAKDESIYKNMESACSNYGKVATTMLPVKTFKLGKGDTFKVSLIPKKITITDCNTDKLKELGVIYYSDDEVFEDSGCSTPVKAEDICRTGITKFYVKIEGKCSLFEGSAASIPRLQGTEVSALVDNTDIPHGNKVFYSEDVKKQWIKAPFIYDAKVIKGKNVDVKALQKHCDVIKQLSASGIINDSVSSTISKLEFYKNQKKEKKSKGDKQKDKNNKQDEPEILKNKQEEDIQEIINIISNFTTYDINCACGTICNSKSALIQGKGIATISRHDESGNCIINGSSSFDQNTKLENITDIELEKMAKSNSDEVIQGLTAVFITKSSDKNDVKYRCMPSKKESNFCYADISSENVESTSLKSDFNYKYENNDPAELGFAIIGQQQHYNSYSGGYNIQVERICNFMYGKKLYMYIGSKAPTFFPGEGDAIELFVPEKDTDSGTGEKDTDSGTGMYTINADGSEKKSGKVFLGIDTRGYEDQFDYSSLPSLESENKYTVNFFIKKWNPNFSKVFIMIRDSLLGILYGLPKDSNASSISQAVEIVRTSKSKGAVQSIYTNQTGAGSLWRALQALCTLYIIFTVLGYVLGVVKCTKYDLGVRIAKIAMVVGLISQGSWEFFSDHFFSIFVQGVSDLIAAFNGELDGDNSFAFLDTTIGVLLAGETWIRLATLILTGPIGWIVFIAIVWSFFIFFVSVIEAVIAYLFTVVAIAFLATLAPIFITFIFFQLTKTLFDAWIKMLVNFSLQPIILFAALAFLNQVMLTVLHVVTGFTVCNQCFLGFDLPMGVTEKGAPPDICIVSVLLPIGYSSELSMNDSIREGYANDNEGSFLGLPFGITAVLMLLLISNAMKGFKGMSETMAHSISGSVAGLSASIHAATQSLASMVGLDQETQSIIKEALRNRRSTGKSDVNIVGRTDTNPESKGEIVGKDGDDDGPLSSDTKSRSDGVHGDGDVNTDKEGANADTKSRSGNDVLDGSKGDVSGNHGRLDSHLSSSGNDVLDTAPSNYDGTQSANSSGNMDSNTVERVCDSSDDALSISSEGSSYYTASEGAYSSDSDTSSVSSESSGGDTSSVSSESSGDDASSVSSESGDYYTGEVGGYGSGDDTSSVSSEGSGDDASSVSSESGDYYTGEVGGYGSGDDTSSVSSEGGGDDASSVSSEDSGYNYTTDGAEYNGSDTSETQLSAVSDVAEAPDVGNTSNSDLNDATNNNESNGGSNNSDTQEDGGKASSAVEPLNVSDSDHNRGKRDINFLEGPQKERLYMDEYSSVAQKIAGHESAIEVEKESHERSIVKRRGKQDQ
ncbi:conjugal transfer protein TrbL [Ehrlichia minasensis]|uniref:Conjugal transfer protein TrbL n=1 Tax=Ehrlichia minasensis TaxID=1242993 RepID=A0A4Q6I7E9_9RICK|nr:type IV secretion system protein [Ehrlichia minasensis]RZB13163.1 conjugal transfer protein TrbL [Ehrlichia minasensis]